MATDDQDNAERLIRIEALATLLIKAGEALDRNEFQVVQRILEDSARQARVLVLMGEEKP